MPSRSRKKDKGRARKAKAAAELQRWITNPNDSICNHGQEKDTPEVCVQFIASFYQIYMVRVAKISTPVPWAVRDALDTAYSKFPEAIVNEMYLEIIKKNITCNAVESIIGNCTRYSRKEHSQITYGSAAALMMIDSYVPSTPIPKGNIDERDPKTYLRNSDIVNSRCQRSMIKYFINQIPCKCLDQYMYAQVRSATPKMGKCFNCSTRRETSSLYICTGCERMQYCSKLCQLEHVPKHKKNCKIWQSGKFTYS